MSFGFKKLVIYGLLLIFFSFSFCTCFDPPEVIDGPAYTNVEYSEDGSSVTIYMDGSAPVPANRALDKTLAQMGHDFFEVTFLYNDNGTYRIARASWELGEPAGISDVYRTVAGVNYCNATNPLGATTTGIPAANEGLVVLFVGRKSDKTLLAVGKLSAVVDGAGVSTFPNISSSTKKVSFDVNALRAGVSKNYTTTYNSFRILTPSIGSEPVNPQRSQLSTTRFGNKDIPYYNLPVSVTATASYTFYVTATGTSYADYEPAIKYAGGALCWNIEPYYTLPRSLELSGTYPGAYKVRSQYEHSSGVSIVMTYPTGAGGAPFNGTANFTIVTTTFAPSVCALTFEIPVYAVYKRTSPVPGETEPVGWKIKPGYNGYYEEIDTGLSENGGAVLIGIGELKSTSSGLIVDGEPRKYNNSDGLQFTLQGIEIWFNSSGTTNLTPKATSGASYDYWADDAAAYGYLRFYYDSDGDDVVDTEMPVGGPAPTLPFGIVKIIVTYDPSNPNTSILSSAGLPLPAYSTVFYVEVNNISSAVSIPYENRFVITKPEDYLDIANRLKSGNYLFVFAENVDLPNMEFHINGDVTIYMVANVEGLTIGRKNGTDRSTFVCDGGSYNVTIYLGRWPFNSPAFAAGNVVTSELFRISSAGTAANFNGSQPATTTMFGWGATTPGTMTITRLAGIEVSRPLLLPVAP